MKGPIERETRQYKNADAMATVASKACLREGLTSWSLGRVLGDSTAALAPGEGRSPVPTETSGGDARRTDLLESVAGHWPTARTTTRTEGSGRTPGETNKGGGDGDARLAVAEGVAMQRQRWGAHELPPQAWEERTQPEKGPIATKEDGERRTKTLAIK